MADGSVLILLFSLQKFEMTPEGISKRAVATVDFYKGVNVRSPINRAFQQLI
jgi:transketolase